MASFRERRISMQDGLTVYCRDYGDPLGSRAPVFCLPGLTRNCRDFETLASRLAATRRVVTPDLRGRGRSNHDPDWRNYRPETYVRDVIALLVALDLHPAVVIGTSLGGVLAMSLGAAAPTMLAGVVLNDVGPVIEVSGIARIAGYVGIQQRFPDWNAAISGIQAGPAAELGLSTAEAWDRFARQTFREVADGVVLDYDMALGKALRAAAGRPLPDLWALFGSLAHVPVLALRGQRSDVLSAETFSAMAERRASLAQAVVPGVGHAPTLDEPTALEAIDAFLAGL